MSLTLSKYKALRKKNTIKNHYLGLEPILADMCNLSWVALVVSPEV